MPGLLLTETRQAQSATPAQPAWGNRHHVFKQVQILTITFSMDEYGLNKRSVSKGSCTTTERLLKIKNATALLITIESKATKTVEGLENKACLTG